MSDRSTCSPPRTIDFVALNRAAQRSITPVLRHLLPGGKKKGKEYVALNPNRSDRSLGSFSTNTTTGKWSDFATGAKGGDLISLWAYVKNVTHGEAAKAIASHLCLDLSSFQEVDVPTIPCSVKNQWAAVTPVPANALPSMISAAERFAPRGFRLVNTYAYDDFNGCVLFYVVRYEQPRLADGAITKEFRSLVYAQSDQKKRQWRCQSLDDPRPLYGLPLLAANAGSRILVVEGEKTCDAARELFPELTVVTSPNGSNSAFKADWSPLEGRDIHIWPDADPAGAKYAADVQTLVTKVSARSVSVVQLPEGLPHGWDLADDVPPGFTIDRIISMLVQAPVKHGDRPLPLFAQLPPPAPFPTLSLGPTLADAAEAIARKVQVSEATASQSVLAAATLVAQAHANVLLPYGQERPLSLFFMTVAASGDRKSTADNEALRPVTMREKQLREAYRQEYAAWKAASNAWNGERKRIDGHNVDAATRSELLQELGPEPIRPLSPLLIAGDLTLEGLATGWVDLPPSLGIFTAEAGQFIGGYSLAAESRLKSAALLSELWDGRPLKRMRAGDGVLILDGRRLSCHLLVQPGAAASFLGSDVLRDQGLLSRFLVAAPCTLVGTRLYREVDASINEALDVYNDRLSSLLEKKPETTDGRNTLQPRNLRLDAEATSVWRQFFDKVELRCVADLRSIIDVASKSAEQAARIAAVLTIVSDASATEIGMAAMIDAISLMEWYLAESLRLAEGGQSDPRTQRASKMLEWLQKQQSSIVLFRDMMHSGPGPLRTKKLADDCVAVLVAHGWLTEIAGSPRRYQVIKESKS